MNKQKYYYLLLISTFITACGSSGFKNSNDLSSTAQPTASSAANSGNSINTDNNTIYADNSNAKNIASNTNSNTNNSNINNASSNSNNSNTNNSNINNASSNSNNSTASNTNNSNSNILLSVDFENGLPGDFSLLSQYFIEPESYHQFQIVNTKAAHGTHSLALASDKYFLTNEFLVTDKVFPLKTSTLYLRFYIFLNQPDFYRSSTFVKEEPTFLGDHTVNYLMLSDTPIGSENDMDANTLYLVRKSTGWHWVLSLPKSKDTKFSNIRSNNIGGTSLSTTQWTCVELMIDTQNRALHVYINNTEDTNLAITKPTDWLNQPQKGVPLNWLPNLRSAYIGYRNFWAENSNNTLYLDDVVFATSRIGCL